MAILDDFKARFPEIPTAQADTYIPILEEVWPCYYGGSYTDKCGKEIVLNLLAHMLVSEVSTGSATVQTVASKSVGSVSVSYSTAFAATSERNGWLGTTKYGLRYLMLTRGRVGAFFV